MARPPFSSELDFDRLLRLRRVEELDDALARGFDINTQDGGGQTLLSNAWGASHDEETENEWAIALLDRGADPDIRNSMGNTALMMAVFYGVPSQVKLLAERGANLEVVNNYFDNAIAIAIDTVAPGSQLEVLRTLIDFGADVNAPFGAYGRAFLHEVVINNHFAMLDLLDGKEFDVDTKDIHGATPLYLAVQEVERLPIARWLIARGANTQVSNLAGKPIEEHCHPSFLAELRSHTQQDALRKKTGAVERTRINRL